MTIRRLIGLTNTCKCIYAALQLWHFALTSPHLVSSISHPLDKKKEEKEKKAPNSSIIF